MSDKSISSKSETDWAKLNAMTDDDIDFSDCPEATSEQFANAIVRHGLIERKNRAQATIQVDDDVLEWFKSQGQSYQAQINSLLRAHMESYR